MTYYDEKAKHILTILPEGSIIIKNEILFHKVKSKKGVKKEKLQNERVGEVRE